MATTTHKSSPFQSLHRRPSLFRRRFSFSSSSPFLTPTAAATITTIAAAALSSTDFSLSSSSSSSSTPAPSTSHPQIASFDLLLRHLAAQDFRRADEETRRLLLALAGEPAQKRGYVFFSEVKFISETDLKEIDDLWRRHSGGRFGYSAQRKVWEKEKGDFTGFFIKVGWMKRLEGPNSEEQAAQYNYRAFPEEFRWELKEDTPEGHLPLTNCLRGTQLLSSILSHPAFADKSKSENEEDEDEEEDVVNDKLRDNGRKLPLVFKPADYSF